MASVSTTTTDLLQMKYVRLGNIGLKLAVLVLVVCLMVVSNGTFGPRMKKKA
jgi:hypothetical protein